MLAASFGEKDRTRLERWQLSRFLEEAFLAIAFFFHTSLCSRISLGSIGAAEGVTIQNLEVVSARVCRVLSPS